MEPKPHGKNFATLAAMTMAQLTKLVKDHHLTSVIGLYHRMRKAGLVNALRKHEKKISHSPKAPPKSPPKQTSSPKQAPKDLVNKPARKRITPTLVKSTSGEPFASKGPKGVITFNKVVNSIEKKAKAMDSSGKGQKLISNSPVRRSARIKTVNDYRSGRAN